MPRYFVTWEIDIDGVDSPRAAAEEAFAHMQRPGTMATVFKVIEHDSGGEAVTIDLLEESIDNVTVENLERALSDGLDR